MATNSPSRRLSAVENGTILSINTSRTPVQNVTAVRVSSPADSRFNPTAPPFVSPAAVYNTGPHGLSLISQVYDSSQHVPNVISRRPSLIAQDQNEVHDGQSSTNQDQAAMPPPPTVLRLFRPTPLSILHQSPPHIARPNSLAIQHSPPRRAYHDPIISRTSNPPSSSSTNPPSSSTTTTTTTRATFLYHHLTTLYSAKTSALGHFRSIAYDISYARRLLAVEWLAPDANAKLADLYERDARLSATEKVRDAYGDRVRELEMEIEDVWAEIIVGG